MRKSVVIALIALAVGAFAYAGAIERRLIGAEDINTGTGTFTDSLGTVLHQVNINSFPGTLSSVDNLTDGAYNKTLKVADAIHKNGPWMDVRAYGTITMGGSPTLAQRTENTRAIQAAIDNVSGTAGATIQLPPGTFAVLGNTIKVNKHRIHIRGMGLHVTDIYCDNGVVFEFNKGAGAILWQCSLKDLSLIGGNTTQQKIAVKVVDTGDMTISNITTGAWMGALSKGIEYHGREMLKVSDVSLYADRPISIEDNPNATIDIDHAHFFNCYLGAMDNTQANFHINSGVNLSNVLIDGFQAWVMGKYGFYWADTTSVAAAFNLVMKNIRWEQATDSTGWSFYLSHNYQLQNLVIENYYGAGDDATGLIGINGLYLRKVNLADISNSYFATTTGKTLLDFDNTVKAARLRNVGINSAATVTATGLNASWRWREKGMLNQIGDWFWDFTTNAEYQMHAYDNVGVWRATATLDNGATLKMPSPENQTAHMTGPWIVSLSSVDSSNVMHGGMFALGNHATVPVLVATDCTVKIGVGDVNGKLTVHRVSNSNLFIRNQSGVTQTVTVKIN